MLQNHNMLFWNNLQPLDIQFSCNSVLMEEGHTPLDKLPCRVSGYCQSINPTFSTHLQNTSGA